MKILLSINVLLLVFGNVSNCQPAKTINQIEVTKTSRGYQENVRLTRDSLIVYIENNVAGKAPMKHTRKLDPKEWTSLIQALDGVVLKDIPALPSPTMKRASDAAMHSTITISAEGGKTYAHGYDNEDPHQALKPLLKMVREIGGPTDKP